MPSAAAGTEDPAMQLSRQGRKSWLQTSMICFHGLLRREKRSAEGKDCIEKIKADREERVNRHAFQKIILLTSQGMGEGHIASSVKRSR